MAVEVTELVGSPKLWTDLDIHYHGKLADRVKSNSTPSAGRGNTSSGSRAVGGVGEEQVFRPSAQILISEENMARVRKFPN